MLGFLGLQPRPTTFSYRHLKLENVFVKHYAPNHMPDPKGEWSLKDNNSQLHNYCVCSKVNQFIYTLFCNYMPNIRIQAKAVLQIFRSQNCSYTKCLCPENGSNSTENLRNSFKVNHFIYTLVCNYMQNIRILAKAVLHLFCSQGCLYTKCLCLIKKKVTQPKIYAIGSKVNHFICTLVCNYMPNIKILAKKVLQIFCSQGCSYIVEKGT